MFDAKDTQTLYSLRELQRIAAENVRPVVLWVGAGASKWLGYPLWNELAEKFHKEYAQYEKAYDLIDGWRLLSANDYPGFFSYCKTTDSQRYYRLLAKIFGARAISPVYRRFVSLLGQLNPLYLLTTNVDESLEKTLPQANTIQKPDVERVADLMEQRISFVAKLHGFVGDITSTVFTTEEYEALVADKNYLSAIEHVFSTGSVVFLGYSLSDQYVIGLLKRSSSKRPVFGAGPHFALVSGEDVSLPDNIKSIKYSLLQHKDHRAALQVLNALATVGQKSNIDIPIRQREEAEKAEIRSGYYISDFFPPGTWQSSQTATFTPPTSSGDSSFTVGQGFVDAELTVRTSPAMHDLTVGLVCFDEIYMPLFSLGMLHKFLGGDRFWNLHAAGAIRFIQLPRIVAMGYENASTVANGRLMSIGWVSTDGTVRSTEEEIQRQIIPLKGHEKKANRLLDDLANKVLCLDESVVLPIPDIVKGALMHPDIRQTLGISSAVLPESIPRWNVFPALRLAHVMTVGVVCQHFMFGAAKIGFGGQMLAGRVFAIAATRDWAEEAASYVLSQKFNTDLGSLVMNEPGILDGILRFRDTKAGAALREEIREQLNTEAGSEFIASVNAGLKRSIPARILQAAQDQLSGLLLAQPSKHPFTPAIWNNLQNSDSTLRLWRKRSHEMLLDHCKKHDIGPYDACPCDSGEKLKFCCDETLRSQ